MIHNPSASGVAKQRDMPVCERGILVSTLADLLAKCPPGSVLQLDLLNNFRVMLGDREIGYVDLSFGVHEGFDDC